MNEIFLTETCLLVIQAFFFRIGCDEILTSLNGTITNPTSPQRQTDSSVYSCKWSIELKETTQPRHVELRFTKFNFTGVMPECSDGDYVELFIGCNNFKPVGKFCGRTSLPVIYSSDHCLQIVFHSFGIFVSSPRSQFKAVYSQRLLSRGKGDSLHRVHESLIDLSRVRGPQSKCTNMLTCQRDILESKEFYKNNICSDCKLKKIGPFFTFFPQSWENRQKCKWSVLPLSEKIT